MYGNAPIFITKYLQKDEAFISTEAERIAFYDAGNVVVWLGLGMKELRISENGTWVFQDNVDSI